MALPFLAKYSQIIIGLKSLSQQLLNPFTFNFFIHNSVELYLNLATVFDAAFPRKTIV